MRHTQTSQTFALYVVCALHYLSFLLKSVLWLLNRYWMSDQFNENWPEKVSPVWQMQYLRRVSRSETLVFGPMRQRNHRLEAWRGSASWAVRFNSTLFLTATVPTLLSRKSPFRIPEQHSRDTLRNMEWMTGHEWATACSIKLTFRKFDWQYTDGNNSGR
jgi:hypothetical protein